MNTYNPPADKLRPPPEKGMGRALLFAALMHVLLIVLIALGVHWKSHPPEAVEAELWAPTAHLAAPRPPKVEAPQPTPTPPPQPTAQPAPPPPPPVAVQPAPDNAEIALAQARKLKQQEEQRQAALLAEQQAQKRLAEKLAAEKLALQQQRQQAREQEQRLAQERQEAQRKQAALEKQQERKAQQLAKQEAEQKAQQQAEKKAAQLRKAEQLREQQQDKLAKQSRSDYMKNLMSQAGNGPAASTGTAAVSSGPSGAYSARLGALVKQAVVYPQIDQIQGDPKVIITVTLDPNSGEVLNASIKRSSGVPSWDEAVLRAIQRVGRFPADGNGRWYTPMEIKAGPRDPG